MNSASSFSWNYAIVKVDGPNDGSYLFMDDYLNLTGDNRLTTPEVGTTFVFDTITYTFNQHTYENDKKISYGISHVSLFRIEPPTTTVPVPASVLLLGSGLIGLVGFSRKKKK